MSTRPPLDPSDAITLITFAGTPSGSQPNSKAFSELRYLHQHAPDVGVRGAALNAMSRLADSPTVIAYLSAVAVDPVTPRHQISRVIEMLGSRLGSDGIEALTKLERGGGITDPQLRNHARSLIAKRAF